MIKKYCLKCGKEFGVRKHRKDSAKFCSRKCQYAFRRINKECLFCGKPFTTTKFLNRSYCSVKCVDDSKKRRATKKCQICGEEYEVQKYYAKTSKYCSIKCRNKGISKNLAGRFVGENNPNYKEKIVKICRYCGNYFRVYQYRKNTANHCSQRCSKLDTSHKTRKKIAESVRELQERNPKIHPNYILAQKGHVTKIEKLVKEELEKRKIPFEFQYRVLRYWIDFAFPEVKLAVECDGNRWHSTEEQISKDKKREQKLKELGWSVLRFKDKEIIKNPKKIINIVQIFIKKRRVKEIEV